MTAATRARRRTRFACMECGSVAPKWVGRCDGCGQWNTIVEEPEPAVAPPALVRPVTPAAPITDVSALDALPVPTGLGELDRVLGGGVVPGSVTLLGGEPGVGKSTLLLQVLAGTAAADRPVLYVTAEESAQQVRRRAERLGALRPDIFLAAETDLEAIVAHVDAVRPALVVVDSVQTIADPALGSAPGSVGQVRQCAHRLVGLAKERGVAVLLVGHVTKDGTLAGPRVLEHVVDTVLSFEGDRHHTLRLLRAVKHRYGSTQEVGLLAMGGAGLEAVADPSEMFLADRRPGVAGSVVVPVLDGHRPIVVEVQALLAQSGGMPRRSVTGVDQGRVGLLLAVIDRRMGLPVMGLDTFAMAVGGAKVTEPGVDLALGLAIISSVTGQAVPADVVACGEVGLGGELRSVGGIERRLAEAARLGFRRAVVPRSTPALDVGLEVLRVPTLDAAVAVLGLTG